MYLFMRIPALQSLLRAHNPPYLLRSDSRGPIGPRAHMYMLRTRAGKEVQVGIVVYAPYLANFRLASPRLACLTDCRLTDQQPWHYGVHVKHISHKTCLSLTCPRQPSISRLWIENTRIKTLLLCKDSVLPVHPAATFPMPQVTSSHVHLSTTPSREHSCMCVYTSKGCLFIAFPLPRQARNDPSVKFHRLTEIFLGKSNTGNIQLHG
ncbi:hypothetical protein GGI43DRAFT_165087 [Trichoderma evansii]